MTRPAPPPDRPLGLSARNGNSPPIALEVTHIGRDPDSRAVWEIVNLTHVPDEIRCERLPPNTDIRWVAGSPLAREHRRATTAP